MKEILNNVVANDVATQRKHYVPPQIEVVELDNQGAILTASINGVGAKGLEDDNEDW